MKPLFALRRMPLSVLLLLLLTGSTKILAEQVSFMGWIPVQTLASGKATEIDLSRFLALAPQAKLEMERPAALEKLKVELDTPGKILRLTPEAGIQGLEDLVLRIRPAQGDPLEGIFTLAVPSAPETKFRYFGTGSEKSVSVAGSFNGWNTGAHPMKKAGENIWELSLALPPGSHTYKLVVDGQWRLDPANKQKAGDGTGNENSLVQVSGSSGSAPVLFAHTRSPEAITFRCHPENWKPAKISAVAQLPGGASRTLPAEASPEGGWRVKTAGLVPEAWIRIMGISADGTPAFPARVQVGGEDSPMGTNRQDHIIYFAFIDRLVDGDPSNNPKPDPRVEPPAQYLGGDLLGVKKLIDDGYFETLGINTLWLSPVNQNPLPPYQEFKEPRRWYTGYHGYWPISSTEVEPRFGGNTALQSLAESAEKKKISILLDLVLAHVHEEHPTFKQHPDWFGSLLLPDGTRNLRKWDNETQFTTWFEPFLPRFNYDTPGGAFLIDNAVDWIKRFNLDGFRLDAVKHIPPKFWTSFRQGLRHSLPQASKDSFYLVGETFMDRPGINSFIGPNRLDGQFEFPLYDTLLEVFGTGKEDFASLERSASSSDRVFGPETVMSPLLGNHDKSRFMAYADGDLPDPKEPDEFVVGWTKPPQVDQNSSYEKLKLAFTFVLTTSGAPTIYYGDEIGMTGAQDPDNRRMFPDPAKLIPAQKSVRDHVAKLNSLRSKHPAIRYGSRRAILADRDTYAVVRAYLGDRVLLVYNRSDKPAKLGLNVGPELADGPLQDRLGTLRDISVKNGFVDLTLPALSSSYLTP